MPRVSGHLAHPGERVIRLLEIFAWDRWDVENFTGLEIWNFSSIWRNIRSKLVVLSGIYSTVTGCPFLNRKPWKNGTLWPKRPVTVFAGSDAHAIPFGWGS